MKLTYSKNSKFEKINILEIGFTDLSNKDILEYINEIIKNNGKNRFFVTPNPEILVMANTNIYYKKVLNRADLALADGMGVILASRLLGKPIKNKMPGVDIVENVCKHVAEQPITVGFLGGRLGVAEQAAKCLRRKYPGLKVTFASSEFRVHSSGSHNYEPTTKIPATDILFVAFGSPKQEIWIAENLDDLPSRITIGVGGAFDFISGRVRRAPKWIRSIGFEWLFRLIIQPWRIKRQLTLIKFIFLVLKEKFRRINV